jgi:hypothetical protein
MKCVARLIVLVSLAFSLGIQPSMAAGDDVKLIRQSPLWVTKNQSFQLVVQSDNSFQNLSLHISQSPLIGRSALDSYRNDALNVSFRRLQNVTSTTSENQTTITVNNLSLSQSGVYVVEVREGQVPVLSSLVSYFNNSSLTKLNTVVLWPIAAPPTTTPEDESLVDDYWQENSGLIEAVTPHSLDNRLSWFVDSDVVTRASENPDWINALRTASSAADVYVAPFANSDVNALIKARKMKLASAAMSSILPVTNALERSNIPRVIVGNAFSPRTWQWIEKQGIYLSITSSQQYPSTTSVFTPSGIVTNPNQKKSLVIDRRASTLMSNALSSNLLSDLHVFQADLFITALEQPQANRTLVLYPTLWNVQEGSKERVLDVFTAPWLNPRSASDAIRKPISQERTLKKVQTSRLSFKQRDLISRLETYRKRLSPFIADSIHDTQSIHASLRVSSVFAKNRGPIRDATETFFNDLLDAVAIVSSGSVVFANESGVIPITIRNNLSVAVYVNVLAKGYPDVRVELGNVDFVEIAAGQRKSIEIPAKLYGSENAFVDLQLVDALGKKIGETKRIEVASSAYSTIAGVFVSVAFGLLFLLLIYNTQKRIRASRAETLENSPRE